MHFKKKLAGMLFAGCAFLGLASVSHAQEPKEIDFPVTPDGQQVLAVDTHTHSLFSDGAVWPNVRVSEAVSSGLDMLAITEHIDYQPKFKDLPNLDRNRAFVVARDAATGGSSGLLVVNGVEIAQPDASLGTFSGHFNAIFLSDANKLLLPTPKNQPPRVDWRKAIRAAKEQGAIMIWNHSWWDQGQTKPQPFHRELMQEKLIDGLEVANAAQYSPSAFQFALDHDLAIVGGSDLHSTMQSFFEYSGIEQRTSTLVLADDKSEAAIKKGFQARRTVALYNHTLIGRERDVRSIVEGALTIEVRSVAHPGDPFGFGKLAIRNAASSPFTLRRVGADMIMDAGPMVTVPARGEIVLTFKSGAEGQSASMDFDVLNAQIAPHTPLRMTLRSK